MSPRTSRGQAVSLILCMLLLGRAITGLAQASVRVELEMARWAVRGGSVRLRCAHDVPPHLLYKVEFLRAGNKIFQYVKDRKPPYRNFTTPGATLSISSATEDTIILQNLDFAASGEYSCEVSLETPIYTKASSDRELTVIQPQKHPPRITFGSPLYTVGDLLEANCTTAPAHPTPHLSWYINGKRVDDSMLKTYTFRVPITYRSGRRLIKLIRQPVEPDESRQITQPYENNKREQSDNSEQGINDSDNYNADIEHEVEKNTPNIRKKGLYEENASASNKYEEKSRNMSVGKNLTRRSEGHNTVDKTRTLEIGRRQYKRRNVVQKDDWKSPLLNNGCSSKDDEVDSKWSSLRVGGEAGAGGARHLSVAVSALSVSAAGRLDLTCVATIPAYAKTPQHFADVKQHSVIVDVVAGGQDEDVIESSEKTAPVAAGGGDATAGVQRLQFSLILMIVGVFTLARIATA